MAEMKNFVKVLKELWKEVLAEFIGTLFLVLVGCGSTIGGSINEKLTFLEIALCFGLTVGVIVHIIGHISGGHINPAVTVGMLVASKIPIAKGICYIIAQLVGAIAGAALLFLSLPSNLNSSLGQTTVHGSLNYGQGIMIEFLITFLLVFGVFMILDPRKHPSRHEPFAIGLIVGVCHIWAIKFTGASMNPARSFGPALMSMKWTDHWVYWVGPILAGIVAGLLYRFVFEPSEKDEPKKPEDVENGERVTEMPEDKPEQTSGQTPGQTLLEEDV